jgi:pyridoxine 5-phosphate synthase
MTTTINPRSQPINLSINVNKIALIRNSRDGNYPDVVDHARQCLIAGADGITVHPRPDQRHIRVHDCRDINALLRTEFPHIEFNIEGNPFAGAMSSSRSNIEDYPGFLAIAAENRPAQCTLVPDNNNQLTSDHGFDLRRDADRLAPIIEQLKSYGCRISLFMDPDAEQIRLAKQVGADCIELYTGPYAAGFFTPEREALFKRYQQAAEIAAEENLGLNAGHDLNLHNLTIFATIPNLKEVSIGHALTVDAIQMGLANAIRAYQHALGKP